MTSTYCWSSTVSYSSSGSVRSLWSRSFNSSNCGEKQTEHYFSDWRGGLIVIRLTQKQLSIPKAPYAGLFSNAGQVLIAAPYAGFSSNVGPVLTAVPYAGLSRSSASSCRDLDLSLKQTIVRTVTIRMRVMRSITAATTPMMMATLFESLPGESVLLTTIGGDGL